MILQFLNHIHTVAALVHKADEGRPQFAVGDILRHVSAHTAVHPLHPSGVPPSGDKITVGIALHIHKDSADDHNTHD